MKSTKLALLLTATCLTFPAFAQDQAPDAAPQSNETENSSDSEAIIVTGSRIKQDPNKSALPLQIISSQDIERNGINNPEQLLSFLTSNGSSADNLASNSDVVTAERRGNNGASFANLRGQGPAATLVLLNGRRVSAHGTTGSAVDVNQIPFMAIERVEVLKDGASAIYGTDAVGGVINFITKKNYKGFGASGALDITGKGDAPIYRLSAIAGYGDLNEQGFNIMGTVGYSWVKPLYAKSRDFIDTFQHDRGLGVDTRGTPFATIVNLAGTSFPTTASFPFIPGSTTQRATGGINALRLPTGPGCDAIDDMGIYDTDVWGSPGNALACAFDTGRNVYLQQKQNTLTYLGRAAARFGEHEVALEITGSSADSEKRFSQVQITPNTTTQNYSYKLVPGVNDAEFAKIIGAINATYPGLLNDGSSFSYRWRCMECGERAVTTKNTTFRAALSIDGPIGGSWDYKLGASYAQSKGSSKLGQGYYFQDALITALNSGQVNPFLFPGQTQSEAGLAAIRAASAEGTVLYGGKYSVRQFDGSVSGSLFDLPAGPVQIAAGVDYRREQYEFNGDPRAVQRTIIAAPFDNANALDEVHRDIKAAYAEILIPLFTGFELSAAGRIDDYSGFGTTTNPKISLKWRPIDALMFRGSFNTAFRVPAFNQLFNPPTSALFTSAEFADPKNCPDGQVNVAAGCPSLDRSIDVINGGNPNLGPETATGFSGGVVFEPSRHFSATVDWWSIHRKNRIGIIPLQYLFTNYETFEDRFIRDASGVLTDVDQTLGNLGDNKTQGIDITLKGNIDALNGIVSAGIDGSYLLKKKEQANGDSPYIDQLGVYSLASDLGLKWKHNAYISYANDDFSITFSQIFRAGYKNQQLPGILSGTFDPPNDVIDVDDYIVYNLSATYHGLKGFKITGGIKNLFDADPPFAISYDSFNGSGSSWEPRIADPRGRSFTLAVETKF